MSKPYVTMSYKTVFIRHFIRHENDILSAYTKHHKKCIFRGKKQGWAWLKGRVLHSSFTKPYV